MQPNRQNETDTNRMNLLQYAYHSGREYVQHGERPSDLEAFKSRFGADGRVMKRFEEGAADRRARPGSRRNKP